MQINPANPAPVPLKTASVRFSGTQTSTTAAPGDAVRFGQAQPRVLQILDRLKLAVPFAAGHALNPKLVLKDFLTSVLFAAATFWLPGSQLVTIPFITGFGIVYRGARAFVEGMTAPTAVSHAPQSDESD